MNPVATKRLYTPGDLLTMPDGDRYELVDGTLVERNMSAWSSYVAGLIQTLLQSFCQANQPGWVFPEGTSYQCFPDHPQQVRKADVSFFRLSRLTPEQAMAEGHLTLAPDLVVEVLSPNDLAYDVDDKVEEWLQGGVPLIWVVNPISRTVRVYRADGSGTFLRENEEITGAEILPGFRCEIRRFFQPPTSLSANP
jgi:Uma2 family endonuclease